MAESRSRRLSLAVDVRDQLIIFFKSEAVMKRGIVLALLLAVGGLSMAAAGLQRGAQPDGLLAADAGQFRPGKTTKLYKVRDNVFRINNTGSNLTAFVTSAGVVFVESGYAGWTSDVLAKLQSVTDKPLVMVIDTIITGHSQLKTFRDWVDQREFVNEYVRQVVAAHKAGKTVDEAVAAITFAPKWSVCPPSDTFASQYPEDHDTFHTQCTYRTDQMLTDTKYAYDELNRTK